VSRPSLREALIALEVEGHIEVRMGSGIYVCPPVQRELRTTCPARKDRWNCSVRAK
jgi:DNA-binding FadR family transcriptional regulator